MKFGWKTKVSTQNRMLAKYFYVLLVGST